MRKHIFLPMGVAYFKENSSSVVRPTPTTKQASKMAFKLIVRDIYHFIDEI